MEDAFKFKSLTYNFRNAETITSLGAVIWKILPNDCKELNLYQCLNQKLKIVKQINVLAEYAKHISIEMVLFDWALLREINVC